MLAVAGKLDLTMGGPSFQDFVIEKPEHSPHYQYRLARPGRSDSRIAGRSTASSCARKQQPFMAALDCADPSLRVDKRNRDDHAAAGARAAQQPPRGGDGAALRGARRAGSSATDAGRVTAAFRLALGREPTPSERDALAAYAREHGLANACRVILNLNEFVFVD